MALRTSADFSALYARNDGIQTVSSEVQHETERAVERSLSPFKKGSTADLALLREKHSAFLLKGLKKLSVGYSSLDASRPWLCYWILLSLDLLGVELSDELKDQTVDFLKRCQDPAGGFAGGPGQLPHLAPTYAAVCSLMIVGTKKAYEAVDRANLYKWLWSLKQDSGAFLMHDGGEVDTRSAYCAAHVATSTNVYTDELFENTAQWVASCQSFDGGLGAVPGTEAHGGYTFCGLAALVLLRAPHLVDVPALTTWAVSRQMSLEGGFQGRTNKLVDGCYSFWQGGLFPILDMITRLPGADRPPLFPRGTGDDDDGDLLCNQRALQDYVLGAAQDPNGGLRDKPGKGRDYYHTCYCLAGLSAMQHNTDGTTTVAGSDANLLRPIHPVRAVCIDKAAAAATAFNAFSPPPFPEEAG